MHSNDLMASINHFPIEQKDGCDGFHLGQIQHLTTTDNLNIFNCYYKLTNEAKLFIFLWQSRINTCLRILFILCTLY